MRPATTRRTFRLAGGLILGAWMAAAAVAQKEPDEELRLLAIGSAALVLPAQQRAPDGPPPPSTVAFSLTPDGPRFALAPIAAALGVELRTGPRGESHTLLFGDQKVIVGSGQATMLTLSAEGEEPEEIALAGKPLKDADGLKVPLDFLARTFGARLNYQFDWRPAERQLVIANRKLRLLTGSIKLVHQHGASTVEVRLSEPPRYQVVHLPGALEIRLIGDRLQLEHQPQEDPLVSAIAVRPDRVRIELVANATAADPRLVKTNPNGPGQTGPRVSLVVEVGPGRAELPPPPSLETRRKPRRAQAPSGVHTIVLDPGHGGEETGAVGPSGTTEAELTLRVGRLLKNKLDGRLKVVLTRDRDVDLPLDSRSALANQNQADLFISLHFNSSFGRVAHGAETFFLSREASDQVAGQVAVEENRSNGSSQGSPELGLQLILWDLAQSYHLAESQRFANLVQEELNLAIGLRDRGVKQAPFRVLMGAMMPAVLVELGFLSNPEEEAKLLDPDYLSQLVDALARAVTRFKDQMEARDDATGTTAASPEEPVGPAPAAETSPVVGESTQPGVRRR